MISVGKDGELAPIRRKRRSWNRDDKRRIVDESREEGASIAEVARRHALNANQLFTWRREFNLDPAARKTITPILPVTIAPDTAAEGSTSGSRGQMEIVLSEGDRILVWADVETAALSRVLKALSRR
ncbi:IS66-like element accessory protein TnpA [Methylocystis hirsuta]|uniref:IS66-like element accessory protein TnpA n=1 Tax=Methylocystis hirsuta TaxID=369798 RepID=UPI001FDEB32B|nr:transposase [Methylocystis hirsuta]